MFILFYLHFGVVATSKSLDLHFQNWDMIQFIRSLKAMVRSSNSVAVITFPSTVLSNSFCRRWQHLADTLLSIKEIPGKLDLQTLCLDNHFNLVYYAAF